MPLPSIKYRGQLFKTLSILYYTITNSVNCIFLQSTDLKKQQLFNIPLSLSKNHPHQGAPSRLGYQIITLHIKKLLLRRLKYYPAI